MGKPRLAWALADFAREPFFSFVLSLAFPPFFVSVVVGDAVRGTTLWGYGLAATSLALILLAPLAGACADATGTRRPWLAGVLAIAVMGMTSLWFATQSTGHVLWVLASIAVAQLAIELSRIYSDSLLPLVVPADQTGRASALGVSLGFTASILFLAIGFGVTQFGIPDTLAPRLLSVGSGLWLIVFMLPCLMLPQPAAKGGEWGRAVKEGLVQIPRMWGRLRAQPRLRRFLVARMLYWDGTMCLFSFIAIVAATQLGWGQREIMLYGLAGLAAGAASGGLAGRAEAWIGTYGALTAAIVTLLGLTLATAAVLVLLSGTPKVEGAIFSRPVDQLFLVLTVALCGALSMIMAISRSMLVALADPKALGEAFGLYVMIGRASSFIAPMLVALSTYVTGEQRIGVFGVAALLLCAGLWVLRGVKTELRGERVNEFA